MKISSNKAESISLHHKKKFEIDCKKSVKFFENFFKLNRIDFTILAGKCSKSTRKKSVNFFWKFFRIQRNHYSSKKKFRNILLKISGLDNLNLLASTCDAPPSSCPIYQKAHLCRRYSLLETCLNLKYKYCNKIRPLLRAPKL